MRFPSCNYRVLQDQLGFRDQQDQKEKGWVWFKTEQRFVTSLKIRQLLKMEKLCVFLGAGFFSLFVQEKPTVGIFDFCLFLGDIGALKHVFYISSVVFC